MGHFQQNLAQNILVWKGFNFVEIKIHAFSNVS